GKLRVAEFYHQVRDVVATEHRERGIRIILKEAVLPLTPQRNELAGLHMPGQARRAITEAHRHRVHSLQDELSLLKRYVPSRFAQRAHPRCPTAFRWQSKLSAHPYQSFRLEIAHRSWIGWPCYQQQGQHKSG